MIQKTYMMAIIHGIVHGFLGIQLLNNTTICAIWDLQTSFRNDTLELVGDILYGGSRRWDRSHLYTRFDNVYKTVSDSIMGLSS